MRKIQGVFLMKKSSFNRSVDIKDFATFVC